MLMRISRRRHARPRHPNMQLLTYKSFFGCRSASGGVLECLLLSSFRGCVPLVLILPMHHVCYNVCAYQLNGFCDDGGPSAQYTYCALGTDCADCGQRSSASALCRDAERTTFVDADYPSTRFTCTELMTMDLCWDNMLGADIRVQCPGSCIAPCSPPSLPPPQLPPPPPLSPSPPTPCPPSLLKPTRTLLPRDCVMVQIASPGSIVDFPLSIQRTISQRVLAAAAAATSTHGSSDPPPSVHAVSAIPSDADGHVQLEIVRHWAS